MKTISTQIKKALILSIMLGFVFSESSANKPRKPQQWNFFWMKLKNAFATDKGAKNKVVQPEAFCKRLKGKSGNGNIALTLTKNKEEMSGSFVDSRTGKPHMLSGDIINNAVTMTEKDEQGNEIGRLTGTMTSENSFTGTWTDLTTKAVIEVKAKEALNDKIKFTTEHLRKENCALLTMNSSAASFGSECSSIDIELLKMNSIDPELNRKINKLIEASIFSQSENKANNLEDYMTSMIRMGDRELFNVKIKCELVSLYNNIMCISIQTKMNAGKENEYINKSFYNFDLRTGSPIKLHDVMVRFYTSKLNPMAEQQFTKNYWKKGWGFEQHKFRLPSNFAITQGGLYFEYNPYEIRQDIEAQPQVFIPYNQIIDIINPLSPLAMMLQTK